MGTAPRFFTDNHPIKSSSHGMISSFHGAFGLRHKDKSPKARLVIDNLSLFQILIVAEETSSALEVDFQKHSRIGASWRT